MYILGFRMGAAQAILTGLLCSALCALPLPGATRPSSAAIEHVELGPVNSSNSEMTNGESRLLKPDLKKKFDPATARFGSRTSSPATPNAKASFFNGLKSFGSSKSATPEKTFPSSAFQPPSTFTRKAEVRSFTSGAFSPAKSASEAGSRASAASSASSSRAFSGVAAARESGTKTPSLFSQEYAGPEADKKKLRYTPENGPLGGTTYGKVLSVEEVREILNKSK